MPDATKAAGYIQQLDEARCNDNWDEVPELIRKVRKHAPERTCLTLTAEIECAIAKANIKHPSAPTSDEQPPASSAAGIDTATQLPALLAAIDHETRPEDRFQARVCAGWLLWVLREYTAAIARLPRSPAENDSEYHNLPENPSPWTKVCILKAAYLRSNCLCRDLQQDASLNAFEASLPGLGSVWAAGPAEAGKQMRYWAELYLTEYCMLTARALREGMRSLKEANCLAPFRTWSKYWAASKGAAFPAGYGFRGFIPRRQVWAEYYFVLSEILQGDLPLPTGYLAVNNTENSARGQLRAELKRVEVIYQGMLYSETEFPRADEQRAEVELFVRRMMENWEVLNGRGWKEHDLGAGGRDSLCRGTLESLNGAAAKTYHSTAILRHLFTVHLAVAEFDLAFRSFDAWFELVKRGRARVQKTGRREPALDDDATMFETISACIAALCRFGNREAAEKAHKLAEELEELVEREEARDSHTVDPQADEVPPSTLALAWQSIGLARAQWARMTYESESRSSIQEKAILCLRKSLAPEFGQGVDARGVFALGVLYAEQRQLSAGIELVRTALLADKPLNQSQELRLGPYWRERSLIPLWHLLALMLSARQEYFMAARTCEGAIEQFKDTFVLFGSRNLNGSYRSEHLNEAERNEQSGSDGLVDEMDDYEKESILQIKMTQLAILELVEGPAVAVNASAELLTLFPRLFGDLEQKLELVKVEPPRTSATIRSFRGSMFGRSEKTRPRQSILAGNGNGNGNEKTVTSPPRPQTTQTTQSAVTTALTVQTSNETVDPHSSRRSVKSEDLKSRRRNSLRKRDRSGSRQRALSTGGPPVPLIDGDKYYAALVNGTVEPPAPALQPDGSRRSSSRSRGITNQPDMQMAGSFISLLPYVQFSPEHNRRRRKAILVKVWLVIAGFYRRAGLIEDATKAILEAQKVAQSLQADVVNDAAGASLSVRQVEWGMEKSAEEVMADVWAEKGELSLACEKPYQARADFETALTHFPNHPGAIVGLSNILLDIYSEKLLPPPAVPDLVLNSLSLSDESNSVSAGPTSFPTQPKRDERPSLPSAPLGLGPTTPEPRPRHEEVFSNGHPPSPPPAASSSLLGPPLPPPHRATSLPLNDRLAARDRAYGLLSTLTKLGTGWNYSEAWMALARAYEESGQLEKARDALWWCVELEDCRGVREWGVVGGAGGYVL
ncbi:hypothetical protein VTI74DRAFT_7394 [Chaetomium olivicolor]